MFASELDCTEIKEDLTDDLLNFQNITTIMKPSLVERVPLDQGFCNGCNFYNKYGEDKRNVERGFL